MAYQINRYNNAVLTSVEEGTVNQATDIKLVGKNYAGYGEIQNENFIFLLENFSGANAPPRALSGQVWYDSASSKLKFYNGSQWKTTGGAEVSASAPSGLVEGDFWWDNANEQLYAQGASGFVLVGPQQTSTNVTQMITTQVRDTLAVTHNVIVGYADGDPVVILSADDDFEIDDTDQENVITGFTHVKKGFSLVNTPYSGADAGVTTTSHRFWGSASDSDKLGGELASDYVLKSNAEFTASVRFPDAGIAIGQSSDLKLFVENDNQGVIQNSVGNSNLIKFKANNGSGTAVHSLTINSTGMVPAADSAFDLGTAGVAFRAIYSDVFAGLATKAGSIELASVQYNPSLSATPTTVALRDTSGNITANEFVGTATQARFADLAEKYTTEVEYSVGTVVAVCEHEEHEMALATPTSVVAGVISEKPAYLMNAEADGQAVALKGRVPVRISGPVKKGDKVFVEQDGLASTLGNGDLVGVALESNLAQEEKLVECFLKV